MKVTRKIYTPHDVSKRTWHNIVDTRLSCKACLANLVLRYLFWNIVHSLNKDLILSVFLHACFPESQMDSIVIFFRVTEQRSRGSGVTSGSWGQEIGKKFQCLNDLWYFSRVWEMIQEADSVSPWSGGGCLKSEEQPSWPPCSVTGQRSASVLWWVVPCHPFSALQCT